jgi:nicotinate-nucleotide pyrophosphorylase (carboxylating)
VPGRRGRDRGLARLVRVALAEDRARDDRTTRALFPRVREAEATVTAQARGILSGVRAAIAVAEACGLRVVRSRKDGSPVGPGTVVLVLRGDVRAILASERTILNFLLHASGVATATARAVRASGRGGPRVLATRKTLPGLRDLEKEAVVHGGGGPHRRDLSEAILVKTNHLRFVPLEEAVRRARRAARSGEPVEVEVRSTAEALRAARAGAETLLLDNAPPGKARRIARELERAGLRSSVRLELSGGITPSTIARYRRVGADAASLGALTHSARALPFHLTARPLPR